MKSVISYLQSFNQGELSRKVDARTDLKATQFGCKKLDNFHVLFSGGVERRAGTEFIRLTKSGSNTDGSEAVKLIPFDFSVDTNYMVEVGIGYIRVHPSDGSTPIEATGTVPYVAGELSAIQHIRRYDTIILTHPNHEPLKLVRATIAPTFTVANIDYVYPPLMDKNITATTLSISNAAVGTGKTLTASTNLFHTNHEGSTWAMDMIRTPAQKNVSDDSSSDGGTSEMNSSELDVSFSNWSISTDGTWLGTVKIQRNKDGAGWLDYVVLGNTSGGLAKNFAFSSTVPEDGNTQIRLVYDLDGTGGGTIKYNIEATDNYFKGLVKITTRGGSPDSDGLSTTATVEVLSPIGAASTTTTHWSEAAFSNYRKFPKAGEFHQNRLFFTGSQDEPATLFGSISGDIYNFLIGSASDMAIKRTVDTPEEAQYLIAKKDMFMGTDGGTVSVKSVDQDALITAANINTQVENSYGASHIQAIVANDVVVYVQRNKLKLRELIYNRESNIMLGLDLNLYSEDITGDGVVEMFVQKNPEQIIWCIKTDGSMCVLSYDRVQELKGWSTINTTGTVISGATLPATGEDAIWLCVNRGTNASPKYCIEKFKPRSGLDWYVDSGVKATGTNITTVSGLDHLEGKTVQVVADGSFDSEQTVSSGSITIENKSSTIIAGLKYTSTLNPMPINPLVKNMEAQSRVKAISKLTVRFLNTKGAKVGQEGKQLTSLPTIDTNDLAGQAVDLLTGSKRFFIGSDWEQEKVIEVKQDLPHPMTVLSIASSVSMGGS